MNNLKNNNKTTTPNNVITWVWKELIIQTLIKKAEIV